MPWHAQDLSVRYNQAQKFLQYDPKVGSAIKKVNKHKITPLLFQPVGYVKVFFYIPLSLIIFFHMTGIAIVLYWKS